MNSNLKIDILPNYFLNEDGTFNKKDAIDLCGKIAGVCYDKEGFNHINNEPYEKTKKRVDMTLNNGHHSVYDHVTINFNIQNIPKILSMVLNNENEYTTSEKSARYTPVVRGEDGIITKQEENLYNKWIDIFSLKIKEVYPDLFSSNKIKKLAGENARYLVTVFMPTQMIYSTSLRQINYIASWMLDYIKNAKTDFEKKLSNYMKDFISELGKLNVLDNRLMHNEKQRKLSLFKENIITNDYFNDVYSTTYDASFAYLAQAQRHRTIDYNISLKVDKQYFVPPIINDDNALRNEWLGDITSLEKINPQGELITIKETAAYDDFILKCKERLCTAAQLEIMQVTKKILLKYEKALRDNNNNLLHNDIKNYLNGARCTFKDFKCMQDCNFKDGKILKRKI